MYKIKNFDHIFYDFLFEYNIKNYKSKLDLSFKVKITIDGEKIDVL